MKDPETYEILVTVTGRDGEDMGERKATVTVEAGAYWQTKVSEIGRQADYAAMEAALFVVPRSIKDFTPLDIMRDDGGAAGGSSFRGLLPAGATAPLAEDDKR